MHAYHKSPIRPKLAKKTIQATCGLAQDPLDSKNTRSQFHNALSTCDSNVPDRCFMMVKSDP